MGTGVIEHVLFDADGVLQEVPGGWYAAMEPYLGDRAREFLHFTWGHEKPTLAGEGDYRSMLAADLRHYGVEADVDEVLETVWFSIEVDARSLAVVQSVREAGFGVHLGTNQDPLRADHMRGALGYEERFDNCFYSCDIGFAKPDRGFFDEAVRQIGAAAETVLFVDDSAANVEGARRAGLRAVHWSLADGHDALIEELATHGVASSLL